jgi:tRNA pseudouridine55 synthase
MPPAFGLINTLKPPGMSSHEVVSRVRRIVGMKRVGHTGTLDPCAAGVLPILLGHACRLADYIAAGPKSYRAEITLGVVTEGADAEGVVTAEVDASALTEADVCAALPAFTGDISQQPPVRSAVFINGQRAYERNLKGQQVEMPTRAITVYAFTPVRFVPGPRARLLADITVSKGTYIRSLAADLGAALGVGGTLSLLIRTQVGHCRLDEAVTLEELVTALTYGTGDRCILAPDVALPHIPALALPADGLRYQWGTWVDAPGDNGTYRIYLDHQFLGLGTRTDGLLRPLVNLQGPPAAGNV